ncbi:methyltransferase domain-containing protein [Ferrovibrio xuzhouensis]|uniref:Methyltransferase domain-containing protein n=1 Tax=Ferrovibrio xuzhouensis TaxID=1576914 RepID=A0ABV7V9V5_9PROT
MSLPDSQTVATKSHLLPILRAAIRAIETDRLGQAQDLLDSILRQEPDFADALHLLGYIALQRGDLERAKALVERAIAIDYHFENYHLTLGHILLAAGDREGARSSFGAALTLNKKLPDPYIGLAHGFMAEGAIEAAIGALYTAFNDNLKHPETNYMLGFALLAKGDTKQAMGFFRRAHVMSPDTVRYKIGFARALRDLSLKRPDPELIGTVLRLLGTPGVEPRDLASVVESGIRLDPAFALLNGLDALSPDAAGAILANPKCPDLAALPAFAAWLAHGLVSDATIEARLRALRRGVLHLALTQPAALERFSRLLALMAVRAFQAEYVDAVDAAEAALLPQLDQRLATADPARDACTLTVQALYRPLYHRPDAARLSAAAWPAAFADLKRIQLDEPLAERGIAAALPALTPIDDAVSRNVQEMYEESPFPRWHQPILGTPLTVPVRLRAALPLQTIPALTAQELDILVAGCGTGLHAILAATSYQSARVQAIDLSRTSLAYASRKAAEIGIRNVDFAQADILRIGEIGRRFDVIESFGVLHHLRDPAAGLAQLVRLLKPDGYMMLGLYSELGRRDVVAARELIARHGFSDSPDDVRRFRSEVWRLDPALAARLAKSSAFHALSDLRDLVFHRQEHRYTPQQLRRLIDGAGLEFLGFEFTSPQPLHQYRQSFPADATATDLDNWAIMETGNPDLFANCYRFWVRHKH